MELLYLIDKAAYPQTETPSVRYPRMRAALRAIASTPTRARCKRNDTRNTKNPKPHTHRGRRTPYSDRPTCETSCETPASSTAFVIASAPSVGPGVQ